MKPLRIWLVGTGTIGTWLAGVLGSQRERLAREAAADRAGRTGTAGTWLAGVLS